ncbi:MAG: DUF4351 domain-containing protein [Acidobacteriaceae bacterium]|nr:DUF4351 domain-containing protein [Acidobacteriaceae bacterium]
MQKYDVALKTLLQASGISILQQLAGVHLARWINTELPQMKAPRLDLLGETETGELVHFELQSTNDLDMPLRMAEYAVAVRRHFGCFPRQFVLYVGQAELRMRPELIGPQFRSYYELIDLRQIEAEQLLRSAAVGDGILAILGHTDDLQQTAREVLGRIAQLPLEQRPLALQQLVLLSGLRGLDAFVQQEAQQMPILIDPMENAILGPAIRKGLEQGMQQGLQQGLQQGKAEGLQEGRLSIIHRLVKHRFGSVPEWVEVRLHALSGEQLEEVSDRLLNAQRFEDLFGNS